MIVDGNYGSAVAYTTNSLAVWSAQPEFMEPPLDLSGAMYNFDPKDDPTDDCFKAGGELFRVMNNEQKEMLISNTAEDMANVTINIKYHHAAHCYIADKMYGEMFAKKASLNLNKVIELFKLSNSHFKKNYRLEVN